MSKILKASIIILLLLCSCSSGITAEKALEGVNNYCHQNYDWSAAEGNPEMMYVAMGEETEAEYQVIFRSYTGAFVYFYVDKKAARQGWWNMSPASKSGTKREP